MNKKKLKRALVISVATVSATVIVLGAAGCSGCGNTTYDNDRDAVVFSSQPFDGVFNPFFSTSAMDSNAVGLTQIGMIANDKDGQAVWGDGEAVVTKSLQTKTTGTPDVDQTTEYYFVLKNNIKFSSGKPLTMKDVLFNMYVYLDPAYTGSSTMYSTDIVGLQEYRTQSASENEQDAFEGQFTSEAAARIMNLTDALQAIKKEHTESNMTSAQMVSYLAQYAKDYGSSYAHIVEDYQKAEELFRKELESDYNSARDSYADVTFTDDKGTVVKNLFTTDVEVFLYNEGLITWNKKDGKLESDISNNVSEFKKWTETQAIDKVFNVNVPLKMDEVINYWATATDLAIEIANDAREEYFKTHTQTYKNISGIEFINRKAPVTVTDNNTKEAVTYAVPTYNDDGSVKEGNEVLKVTINGIDPKAIWNFSFGVAPMYYYSNSEQIELFDYETHFGVEYSSASFMSSVVKNGDKLGVPVGAGPYMAADSNGNTDDVESGDFLDKNIMYFHSNPYYLMGEPLIKNLQYKVVSTNQIMNSLKTNEIDFGEPNAKKETIDELEGLENEGLGYSNIRTAGYGYVGINASKVPSIYVRRAIMHSIDPSLSVNYYSGTAEAIYRPMSLSSWAYPKNSLPYYPYIGGKIPEDLSKVYPEYATYVQSLGLSAGQTMTEEQQIAYIKHLVEDLGGYSPNSNGIYFKGNDTLKYTFTIAGQENDHPAFNALYQAGQFLTDKVGGFQITTKPDNNALTKLANGALTVWAAAWGSTIDPDMYQVYHIDSKAGSTLNWGYNAIRINAGDKYKTELDIVNRLSTLIEQGRETDVQSTRANIYEEALNLVMELAVELPMYQRDDLFAYNTNKIDASTFNSDTSAFKGLTSDIHKLSLVTER